MKTLFCLILTGIIIGPMVGLTQQITGKQIAENIYNREDGKDSLFTVKMTLIDKKGRKRVRQLKIMAKDHGDLVNSFIEFTSPADIDGTRFLTLENKDKDNTQHLYLPALGRSRRIVGGQKKQSFVNTDFTYEDMERRDPNEDTHKLLRSEKFNEWDCYVLESIPMSKKSQYSKIVSWVDKKSFIPVKSDFYNKKNQYAKVFIVKELEQKDGIWTQKETVMKNLKRKTQTLMTQLDAKFNIGLDDKIFTVRHLEKK